MRLQTVQITTQLDYATTKESSHKCFDYTCTQCGSSEIHSVMAHAPQLSHVDATLTVENRQPTKQVIVIKLNQPLSTPQANDCEVSDCHTTTSNKVMDYHKELQIGMTYLIILYVSLPHYFCILKAFLSMPSFAANFTLPVSKELFYLSSVSSYQNNSNLYDIVLVQTGTSS